MGKKKRTEFREPIYKKAPCSSCFGVGMFMGIRPCKTCSGVGHIEILVGERITSIIEEDED